MDYMKRHIRFPQKDCIQTVHSFGIYKNGTDMGGEKVVLVGDSTSNLSSDVSHGLWVYGMWPK